MNPASAALQAQGSSLVKFLSIGIGYALSAGLQPGPLQAFFLAKVAKDGWRKTLPAAFAPLVSDGPIALAAITLIQALPDNFRSWLQLAGGFLLIYFAWSAFRNWRQDLPAAEREPGSTPKTIGQAALINLFNPAPYLGWSLVMGPTVISAWQEGPWLAAALLLAFYITMICTSLVIIYFMGQALLIGPGARKTLSLLSALLLVGLGIFFLVQAGGGLLKTVL